VLAYNGFGILNSSCHRDEVIAETRRKIVRSAIFGGKLARAISMLP
jgi:hypothetical protein